ncbi:lipoyl amidotransferase LIPT1, mitochondrial [Hydra vulgaris]|nr:lipoyltransferase 1, mitochondrial [Hydra vulgaris]
MLNTRSLLKYFKRRSGNLSATLEKSPIWLSLSNCVYENISFEEYIYENVSLDVFDRILFIWRNTPSVVIGRHQNPWKEVNLKKIEQSNIKLCRRNSGGGAVYHDLGNVNFTVFSNRELYNRKENLNFVVEFFKEVYKINLEINHKDDIIFERFKVSGSAAKVGLNNAYHHFTLLCNANVNCLSEVLQNSFSQIQTSATQSVSSPIKNLFYNGFDFADFVKNLTEFYHIKYKKISNYAQVHPINYPISHKVDLLKAWDWTYGKSPKFSVDGVLMKKGVQIGVINIVVQKGLISEIQSSSEYNEKLKYFVGIRFDPYKIIGLLKLYDVTIHF